MTTRTLALLLVCASTARAASGGAPLTVSQTGYALDAGDLPISSSAQAMTFRIFDADTTGTAEWTATCDVAVRGGYYAVQLGAGACAGDGLDTADLPPGAARFLEVSVGAVVLTPRLRLNALPAAVEALHAIDSDTLGGQSIAQIVSTTLDPLFVHRTGAETIAGAKTLSAPLTVAVGAATSSLSGNTLSVGGNVVVTSAGSLGVGTASPAESIETTGKIKAISFVGSGAELTGINTGVFPSSVKLGGDAATCDGSKAGAIRWSGTAFEGCDGGGTWLTLGTGGGSGGGNVNAQTGTAYTLAAGDANNTVTLTNAAAITATVPPGTFAVGTVIELFQNGAGVVTVAPGAGVTINALDGVRTTSGQFSHATLRKTAAPETWSLSGDLASVILMTATGGTVSTIGNFKFHTFTDSSTFTITQNLSGGTIDYLVVAGGGGGGGYFGGGGGAGGLVTGSMAGTPFTYPVTIGAGGAAGTSNANGGNGGNSQFHTVIAIGGGGGGGLDKNGLSGGSGGGGSRHNSGGSGTPGQGYPGGQGCQCDNAWDPAGGGGGFTGPGVAGSGSTAGAGGAGFTTTFAGPTLALAGGGGGGLEAGTPGSASHGGGAGGPSPNVAGFAGTPNTGGGGGGGHDDGISGGPGGSGIVIVKYQYRQ